MTTVILGTIAPSKLNLNGDQGNLLALKRFIEAAGLNTQVRSVSTSEAAAECHFLLLGHGSQAAMDSLEVELGGMDWDAILSTVPGIAVGSGYEWLAANGKVDQQITRSDRVSEFQVGELGPVKALGYRNTDTDLPNLKLNQAWICSMLHGPVLAKNPVLLARAAKAAAAKAGLTLNLETDAAKAWIKTLNRISSTIWTLETEEPFQPLA